MWTSILTTLAAILGVIKQLLERSEFSTVKQAGKDEANAEHNARVIEDVELVKKLRDNVDAIPDSIMYSTKEGDDS